MANLRSALWGPLLLPVAIVSAQGTPKTLAQYLPSLKSEGPVFALDAAKVRAAGDKQGLAAFDRQRVKVGAFVAIVPTEMVVVDDSFQNAGSLTDGLPAQTKLLYLLQSLTSEQWKRITGAGIGLSDLQGEQRAVFQSILPKRLGWRAYRLKKDGMDSDEVGKGEVPKKDLEAVKIRIFRDLSFDVNLADNVRARTTHDTYLYRGKPGDLFLEREGQFEEGADDFGLPARQAIPNVAKPSALKYDAKEFDALVTVPKNASVREVLAAVGPEIYADLRVADLKVTFTGGPVRTGDLLKALALGVTGTFRRVGAAYVLTSDSMGLGTRKLRYSLWWEDIRGRSLRLADEWRRKIGERVEQVGFDKGSPFTPNASMQAHLAVQDTARTDDWISSNDLSAPVRDYLNLINRHYPHQRIDTGKVRLTSQFRYGFVLPDGRTLRPEIQALGTRSEFAPRNGADGGPARVPPFSLPIAIGKSVPRLAIRAETPTLAKTAAGLAVARGFQELWIETDNPTVLPAAVEAGKKDELQVRLLIRPWSPKTGDPDRNLLGDTGAQMGPRLGALNLMKEMQRSFQPEPLDGYDRMTPFDPERTKVWGNYLSMAATPGLAGVVVASVHTLGYEGPSDRLTFYGTSRALQEARKFGYSEAQRLAFLRKHGIDPIDLVPTGLMTGPDLRQPFFLDDNLRGLPTIYDGRDVPHPGLQKAQTEWARFRSEAFQSALLKLLNDLGGTTSVIVSPLPSPETQLPTADEVLVYWDPNSPLPTINRQRTPALVLSPLATNPTPAQLYNVSWLLGREEIRTVVDLRQVPSGSWASLLDRVLAKPVSTGGQHP